MSELTKRFETAHISGRNVAILLAGGLLVSSLTACGEEVQTAAARPRAKAKLSQPQYSCERLTVDSTSGQPNTVDVKVQVHESGKAQFIGAAINFHDGLNVVKSDAFPGTNESFPVSYQFTHPGKHTIDATARFIVDGQMMEVTSLSCRTKVTVDGNNG